MGGGSVRGGSAENCMALGLGIVLSEVTAPEEPSLEAVTALDVVDHPLATHSAAVVH